MNVSLTKRQASILRTLLYEAVGGTPRTGHPRHDLDCIESKLRKLGASLATDVSFSDIVLVEKERGTP